MVLHRYFELSKTAVGRGDPEVDRVGRRPPGEITVRSVDAYESSLAALVLCKRRDCVDQTWHEIESDRDPLSFRGAGRSSRADPMRWWFEALRKRAAAASEGRRARLRAVGIGFTCECLGSELRFPHTCGSGCRRQRRLGARNSEKTHRRHIREEDGAGDWSELAGAGQRCRESRPFFAHKCEEQAAEAWLGHCR